MKRQRNFDSLKRLVRGWLCRHGRHRWSYFTKQTKTLVFYERSCQWCGLFEINSAGPTGDKKWHKPESCFNGPCGDWEREQYNTANTKHTGQQKLEKGTDMTDNAKPTFAGTCEAPCSARDRFTLDPESGFVYDRENEEWLTEPVAVFDAMWPLLPNAHLSGGTLSARVAKA